MSVPPKLPLLLLLSLPLLRLLLFLSLLCVPIIVVMNSYILAYVQQRTSYPTKEVGRSCNEHNVDLSSSRVNARINKGGLDAFRKRLNKDQDMETPTNDK